MPQIESSGLVQELQHDAMDESVSLATVLRRALIVSKKLDAGKMDEWLELELGGYPVGAELPTYRKVLGEVKGIDLDGDMRQMILPPGDTSRFISTMRFHHGAAELANLLEKSNGILTFNVPAGIVADLRKHHSDLGSMVVRIMDYGLVGVLNAIRQKVYSWSLTLDHGIERDGTFRRPQQNSQPTVQNFNFENISNSQIGASAGPLQMTQGAGVSELLKFLREAQGSIKDTSLADEAVRMVEEDVGTAIAQLQSPAPRHGILSEALKSVRTILEGAAGNMLASELVVRLGTLMRAAGLG